MNRQPIFPPEYSAAAADLDLNDSDVPQDDDPTLTANMLEIYFSSTRPPGNVGNANIWRSTRAADTDPWGKPEIVDKLRGEKDDMHFRDDENPGISGDGLTLWFSSNRDDDFDGDGMDDVPGLNIYVTHRQNGVWTTPTLVTELNIPQNTATSRPYSDHLGPEPAPSMQRIVLYGGDGSNRQLFEATRSSDSSSWDPPTAIESLNTPYSELSGFFVTDTELWFAAARPDLIRAGGSDIYRATRASVDSPFETPELVEGVNTPDREDDPWLSPDGHTLFFTGGQPSEKPGEDPKREIYFASRP